MSIEIPIEPGDTLLDLQTPPLEGVVYTLEIRWNIRIGAYFMKVYDQEGVTLLAAGLKLVANWPLGAYGAGRQPPGAFVAIDTSGRGLDPGLDELGDRVKLVYFTKSDLGL